jgi:ElaB/YqjD/DUF883 family membrane-anchored ribosome-binding protein
VFPSRNKEDASMDGRKDYTSNAGQMPGASRSDAQGTLPSSPLTPRAGSGVGQSTSAPPLSGLRQQVEQTRSEVGEALDRGRAGIAESASVARDSLAEDMSRLRDDVASLKETLARFASQAGSEASQTLRQVGQTVASQVGTAASGVAEAGSELAASAKEQAKTLASELETMARRNPLGALAGAVFVGVIIGIMSRGRR